MVKKAVLLIFMLSVCIIGCSKQEETPVLDQSEEIEIIQPPERGKPRSADHVSKQTSATESGIKKNGRILTAEEQMRQYYAQQGYSAEEIEQKMSQTYHSKPRREIEPNVVYTPRKPYRNQSTDMPNSSSSEISEQSQSSYSQDTTAQSETQPEYGQSLDISSNKQSSVVSPPQPISDYQAGDSETEYKPDQPDYSDSEPPELISAHFDPMNVQPGQELTVKIQAVDNLSGVQSVFGIVKNPSDTVMISFSCSLVEADGTFQGKFIIPEHAEEGTWGLKNIRLTDAVHNSQNYTTKHPVIRDSTFTVANSDSDVTGPHATAIYVDPSQATGGERVQIMIEAVDDKSGVARVYGVFASPSKNARLSFACQYIAELNIFEGAVNMPQSAESGFWVLDYLRLEDNAKNSRTYYYKDHSELFNKARIDVYSKSSDSQPPVLENVAIYPSTVIYGETVKIIVSASDDISGIQHISGTLHSASRQGRIPFHCVYVEDNQKYVAQIIIQEHTEVGIWRIENMILSDNAHNQASYSRYSNDSNVSALLEYASFEVIGQ
ncbi:MAG: hypothetical protein RBU23_06070 [Candidatus Auribacterota bacterium]|jgi:hypothetical protein|nr:hypothetical protein [Candidatus Auribacterota bacterium]